MQAAYPKKPVIIAEIGWPSEGRIRAGAVASVSNEALFLRRFLARAEKEGERYYIMEAFDQPWKARDEGAVGAYWGIYDVNRQPKFEFMAPIVRIPAWHMLAAISVTLALLMLGVFYMHSGSLRTLRPHADRDRGVCRRHHHGVGDLRLHAAIPDADRCVVGSLLILGMLGVVAVLFAEAHEWAEAHWTGVAHAPVRSAAQRPASTRKVSVHVPAYNEPPDMLIETLDALARLNYPNFEVIVVDNNTARRGGLAPGRGSLRQARGALPVLSRRAAGRLQGRRPQLRAAQTAADAQVIAVIDSDYKVDPDWLLDLVPAFDNARIAIVQAPQDYRDEHDERLQGHVLRRIPRLLLYRHDHAQRAQRDHPARHHDAGAALRAGGGRRLGGVVHHRGRGTRPAGVRGRIRGGLHRATATVGA